MKIRFHRKFEKQYVKLRRSDKEKFKARKEIFLKDEFDPILNNHPLKGKFKGYRSINVTGDLRAVYRYETKDKVIFVVIDSHSNLYK